MIISKKLLGTFEIKSRSFERNVNQRVTDRVNKKKKYYVKADSFTLYCLMHSKSDVSMSLSGTRQAEDSAKGFTK